MEMMEMMVMMQKQISDMGMDDDGEGCGGTGWR